jgi:hypothetical protein
MLFVFARAAAPASDVALGPLQSSFSFSPWLFASSLPADGPRELERMEAEWG